MSSTALSTWNRATPTRLLDNLPMVRVGCKPALTRCDGWSYFLPGGDAVKHRRQGLKKPQRREIIDLLDKLRLTSSR